MKKDDLKYIVNVLKGIAPQGEPDWFETLGFLQCHKIAGMFYSRANAMQLPMPEKIKRILQNIYDSQTRRVRYMRTYIVELANTLYQRKTPHAFLKGSVLCNVPIGIKEIYADGERVSNDIDILVMPQDLDAVNAALKDLGYTQGKYNRETDFVIPFARTEILSRRMNRGEIAPFVKRTGNAEFPFIEIDVNFSLGNTPNDGAELLREMVKGAERKHGKIQLNAPTKEMLFLHLVMHQYKESFLYFTVERGKDLDLYKLADLYYLYNVYTAEDIKRITDTARAFGIENRVGAVLRQVGEVFGDNAILQTAKQCGNTQPRVKDYTAKKEYVWQSGIVERICTFDTKRYLRET